MSHSYPLAILIDVAEDLTPGAVGLSRSRRARVTLAANLNPKLP